MGAEFGDAQRLEKVAGHERCNFTIFHLLPPWQGCIWSLALKLTNAGLGGYSLQVSAGGF